MFEYPPTTVSAPTADDASMQLLAVNPGASHEETRRLTTAPAAGTARLLGTAPAFKTAA